MNEISELIFEELGRHPLAGITLSLGAYLAALTLYTRFRTPWLNPLLISSLMLIGLIEITPWTLEAYEVGGRFITMLLPPATVMLALPLYRQRHLLKRHSLVIMISLLAGSFTAVISVSLLARLMDLPAELRLSLLPKSVTTAIAVGIAEQRGGMPSVTAIAVVLTGLTSAITLPVVLKILRIHHPVAQGLAAGTSGHALGTARVLELGDEQGAMGSLAIGITGLLTVVYSLWF